MLQKPWELFHGEKGDCQREGKHEKAGKESTGLANRMSLTVETAISLGLQQMIPIINMNEGSNELAITKTDRRVCIFSNHPPIKVKTDDHFQF